MERAGLKIKEYRILRSRQKRTECCCLESSLFDVLASASKAVPGSSEIISFANCSCHRAACSSAKLITMFTLWLPKQCLEAFAELDEPRLAPLGRHSPPSLFCDHASSRPRDRSRLTVVIVCQYVFLDELAYEHIETVPAWVIHPIKQIFMSPACVRSQDLPPKPPL